jgi:hypothetical protein
VITGLWGTGVAKYTSHMNNRQAQGMGQVPSKISDIAAEIRRYLVDHPNATDSLDGVQRWWLARSAVEAPSLSVQQALDLLIHEGSLLKKVLPDGTAVYAGNRRGLLTR